MSDEPPSLPDTDDPFALLGVTRHVDARALRKAYAALIKLYRPERAPAEFARIQRAYELAQLALREDAAGEARADEPIQASPAVRSPGAAALDALDGLMTAGRYEEAAALVDDDDFAAAAAAEPVVGLVALRALMVLAWYSPRARSGLDRLDELPRHHAIDLAHAGAEVEIAAAEALTGPGAPTLPPAILDLLRRRRTADVAARVELEQRVAELLDEHGDDVLRDLDRLVSASPAVASALAAALYLGAPPRIDDLTRWPAPVRAALARALDPTPLRPDEDDAIWPWRTRRRYARRTRGPIAAILIADGLPLNLVTGWLRLTSGSRHARFRDWLERDQGLELLGLVAAAVRRRRATWQAVADELEGLRDLPGADDGDDDDHDEPDADAERADDARPLELTRALPAAERVAAEAALSGVALPADLAELLASRGGLAGTEQRARIARLARLLVDRPREVLRDLDRLAARSPAAAAALETLLHDELPRAIDQLDELPASVRSELERRAGSVKPPPHERTPIIMGLMMACCFAVGLMWLTRVPALMVAAPAAVVVGWHAGGLRYRWFARPALAELLIDLAVPCDIVTSWLAREQPGRFQRDRRRIVADHGLHLLGLVAALVREERLCWPDRPRASRAA